MNNFEKIEWTNPDGSKVWVYKHPTASIASGCRLGSDKYKSQYPESSKLCLIMCDQAETVMKALGKEYE